jgi:hypothetical protein
MFRALLEEDSQRSKKTRDAQRPITALCHIFEYVTQGSYKAPRGMGVPPMKHGQDARATPAHCPLVVKPQRHRGTEVFGWAWFVFFIHRLTDYADFLGLCSVFGTTERTENTEFLGRGMARLFHAKARRREDWRASLPASRLPLRFPRGAPDERLLVRGQAGACPILLRKPDDKSWSVV